MKNNVCVSLIFHVTVDLRGCFCDIMLFVILIFFENAETRNAFVGYGAISEYVSFFHYI